MSLHNNFRARRINVNTYWKNSTDLCERASDYEELSTGNAHFTCSEVFFTYTAFNVSQRAGTKQTLISVWHWKKCNQSVAHERKSRWIEKRLENFSASRFDFSWSSQRKKEWDRNVLSGSLSIRLGMFTFFPFIRSRKARETHKAMARCIITMGRFLRLQHNYRNCVKISTWFFIARCSPMYAELVYDSSLRSNET